MEDNIKVNYHQIEEFDKKVKASIFTNSGFIGKYLSEKLLELPLQVLFYSQNNLEEIEHLKVNKKFKFKVLDSAWNHNLSSEEIPDYCYQIIDFNDAQKELSKHLKLTGNILNACIESGFKYQLVALNSLRTESSENYFKFNSNQQVRKRKDGISLEDFVKIIKLKKDQHSLNTKVTVPIDVYGPKMKLDNSWELPRLLQSIIDKNNLIVLGEGLTPLFPIFVKDLAAAIIKVMLTDALTRQSITIGGNQEITSLNLAYKLREILLREQGNLLEIKYLTGDTSLNNDLLELKLSLRDNIFQNHNLLRLKTTVNIDDGLKETVKWLNKTKKNNILEKSTGSIENDSLPKVVERKDTFRKKIKQTANKRRLIKPILISLILIFFLSIFIFISEIGLGSLKLYQSLNLIRSEKFENAEQAALNALFYFKIARSQYRYLPNEITGFLFKNKNYDLDNYLELAELTSKTLQHVSRVAHHGIRLKDGLLGNSQIVFEDISIELSNELISVYKLLSYLETEFLQDEYLIRLLKLINLEEEEVNLNTSLKHYRKIIKDFIHILNITPDLFGDNGKRKYLVLLQNNAELRPTGGFIGSYATITFENSKLLELEVDDVYTIDGQLKGHVEPPFEIKTYLGEAGWYLRDANWDPDFPTSARQIEWFFEKESKENIDGVIAINLYVIQELLKSFGAVNLPDFEETITAENLFEISEYYSEVNFFPGSTQKKDFLGGLTTALFNKLENASPEQLLKIAQSLYKSLENGHLLIFVNDQKPQKIISENGWDGSIKKIDCPSSQNNETCLKTYIYLNEANVGVNKSNYFIRRKIDISQNIDFDKLSNNLAIKYFNQSQGNSWPGGTYRNYLRIYLEEEVEIKSVMVDGKELKSNQLIFKSEHGKQVVGFLIEVPPQQELLTELSFESGVNVSSDKRVNYVLYLQKQSGTQDDPLSITISKPKNLSLVNSSLPLSNLDSLTTNFSQEFTKDIDLIIDFEKLE